MSNTSTSPSVNSNLEILATTFTVLTIVLACVTILFNAVVLFRIIYYGKLKRRHSKCSARRICLLHSMNTYLHIMGSSIVFLLMVCRTLFRDLYLSNKEEVSPSWYCLLLHYLMSIFGSGIYGSCLLHAFFRFSRLFKPYHSLSTRFSYQIRLIVLHWTILPLIYIPTVIRAVYLPSENFCLFHFNDRFSAVYIFGTSIAIPVTGTMLVYLKILLFMKDNWQSRKRWRQMKRDVSTIRRILLLLFVLTIMSTVGCVPWLITIIRNCTHPLLHRLLFCMVEIGMLACSFTLLLVSKELRRAIRFPRHRRR